MTSPYYADDMATLYHGDCLDVLADLPDCSIDAVVTDPPYGRAWKQGDTGSARGWMDDSRAGIAERPACRDVMATALKVLANFRPEILVILDKENRPVLAVGIVCLLLVLAGAGRAGAHGRRAGTQRRAGERGRGIQAGGLSVPRRSRSAVLSTLP